MDILHRFICHRASLENNSHCNKYLQAAYNKYGKDSFTFNVVQPVINLSNLRKIENGWVRLTESYRPEFGYNICGVSDVWTDTNLSLKKIRRSSGGWTLSEETRRRMSEAKKGISHPPEVIAKIVASRKKNYKGQSENQKEATRLYGFKKGCVPHNKGVPSPLKGIPRSAETISKLKASSKGRYWGQGLKLRKPIKGTNLSGDVLYFESTAAGKRGGFNNICRAIKCNYVVGGYKWEHVIK